MARREAPELSYHIVPSLAAKNGRVSWGGEEYRISSYAAARSTRKMVVALRAVRDNRLAEAIFTLPKGYQYNVLRSEGEQTEGDSHAE